MTDLWTKAEPHAGLLAQLMATCLKQAAQHDPLAAADLAAALVRAVGNQPAFALVQPALANLLEKLTEFVTGASARQLDDLAGHLAALEKVPALQGRITDLQASIRTRGPSKNPITS